MAWDGSASRFTDQQYERACVLDRGVCGGMMADAPAKTRCSLPIREPGGGINEDGLAAAAQRIGQVQACPAAIAKAKAALRSAYKAAGKEPPTSIAASAPRLSFASIRQREARQWLLGVQG